MEILITILLLAVTWLFIKSSGNDTNITRINADVENLLAKIKFLQHSINGLEKSRNEQRHKNYDLRKKLTDLQSAKILNKSHILNKSNILSENSMVENPNSEGFSSANSSLEVANSNHYNTENPYDINDINDLSRLNNKLPTIFPTPRISNPNFPTFIYKEALSNPLSLAYSFNFSQFLSQKRQLQQTQNQVTPTLSTQDKVRQETPQFKPPIITPIKPPTKPRTPPIPPEPSLFDKAFEFAKNWLTTGNIPVKIGMLIMILPVIAFLRYAATMGWIHVPIHFKLLGVALSALGALAFAWTKRHSKRSFSLSVQGGSIGIVLLTIFSAVKMYPLISPTVGFLLSLAMVLLTAVLSIQQNAKVLVLMAIFTGFLAPIWLSDGSGSHVMLFSYYAILNVGIFIVAMFRPWRELNVLGFVFTYLIGSTLSGLNYTPENFNTIEPFVILFFFFYLLIPLRYAQQAHQLLESRLEGGNVYVDSNEYNNVNDNSGNNEFYKKYRLNSGLLFGAPLVTLVSQVALLDNDTHLALSCLAMGLIYGALAFLLRNHRSEGNEYNQAHEDSMFTTLQKTYTGLSASFLTLAVPIGMSAKATTTIFALEGAGAIWLGAKINPQRRRTLTWLAGGFLQLSSAVAFIKAYSGSGYGLHGEHADAMPIFNELYISGIVLAIAGFLCAWFSFHAVRKCESEDLDGSNKSEKVAEIVGLNAWLTNDILVSFSRLFFLWGMAWWIGTNVFEITRVMDYNSIEVMYGWMMFMTATAVVLPIVYHHRKGYNDGVVYVIVSLLIMTGGGVTLIQWLNVVMGDNDVPLAWAIVSWAVYALGGFIVWRGLQTERSSLIDGAVVVWFLALTLTISTVVYQLIPHSWQRQSGWHWGIIFAVWIVVGILDTFRPQTLAWLANRPTSVNKEGKELANIWQIATSWIVVIVLSGVFAITTLLSGTDGWWLPVLNSLDGLQIGLAFLILAWCVRHDFFAKVLVAYAVGLSMVISMSVRMARHWIEYEGNWHGNIQYLSDWNWLMIFGFWTVLGFGLWAVLNEGLTDRLSAVRERLSDITLEVFQVFFNSIMLILIAVWCLVLFQSGEVSPWLPLLNPLAVLQWSILALLLLWANGSDWQDKILDSAKRSLVLACMILLLISVMTLRFVFHFYQTEVVSWGSSMFNMAIIQMSLTLIWTILGVFGWIIGSKSQSKAIWLSGTLLMAVVFIKLVFIDRAHLNNLYGIISFFFYAFLCAFIGYIAPMPSFSETDLEDEE